MIQFNKPFYTGKEIQYMQEAMSRDKISGDGYFTKKVSEFFENEFGTKKALFVTSGSAALDMAALLLDLGPGDEVIMPSYTFVSTANAVVLRGAKPVFVEIDPANMNLDLKAIEAKITKRTKSIWPVHYAGISCDMDAIMEIARFYGLTVVEDAAQAVNSKYKDRYLGTIGHIGCYSFHDTKNYTCGEGGAILINDPALIERAEIIREKGTNRSNFIRGQVDKYSWVDYGTSFLGADILSAFLLAQLEEMEAIRIKRREIYLQYETALKRIDRVHIPVMPAYSRPNYHMFYMLLESSELRNNLLDALKSKDILATFHYVPLHSSDMGRRLGYCDQDLEITNEYASKLLRLPFYTGMSTEEILKVINAVEDFFKQ